MFNRISKVISAVFFVLGLVGPVAALAATTPSLGTAATYGVLASTYTNTVAGTVINGDVGFTTGPAVAPTGVHTNYGSGAPFSTAGTDQGSALSALASQSCTFTFAPGAIDLAADTTHGPIGVYTPGVYCVSGAASIGTGGVTLNGSGTYIFRINGALTSVANSVVTLAGGASACDVFWTPTAATTLGANSTFVGNNIDASGITIGSTVNWTGRALAFGGTDTTNADTITAPTCTVPLPPVAVNGVCGLSNNTTVPSTPTTNLCSAGTASSVSGSGPWAWTCAGSNGGTTANCSAQETPAPTPVVAPVVTPTPTPAPTPAPTVVTPPPLPSAGVAPDDYSFPWKIVIPVSVLSASVLFYIIRRKQTI